MKCKLCKTAKADKKKSHIIPKFLKKGLFGPKGEIRGYKIQSTNPKEKPKSVQDIPKENHILCTNCERRLSTLETYFANHLYNQLHKSSGSFKVKKYLKTKVKSTKDINANLINLLLQSILWRQHISQHESMVDFTIDKKDAEVIRKQLNKIIAIKKQDMLDNMSTYKKIFKFFPYLIWTHTKLKMDDNFVLAIPRQTGKYFLVLNAIRVHMCSSGSCFTKNIKGLNINDSKVSVLLIDSKQWRKESNDIFSQILKYTWGI